MGKLEIAFTISNAIATITKQSNEYRVSCQVNENAPELDCGESLTILWMYYKSPTVYFQQMDFILCELQLNK